MYAGPAAEIAPTFGPLPPVRQSTGPITGDPVIPSPTTGNSSLLMKASFFGHPGRYGSEPTLGPPGSPWGAIAYRRVFANSSCPVAAIAESDAVFRLPMLVPPSVL